MRQKSELCIQFEALGLTVDDTGVIRDHDGAVYGMLTGTGLVMSTPNGNTRPIVSYEDVNEVGVLDDGTLVIDTDDGRLNYGVVPRGSRDVPALDGSRQSMEAAFPLVFPDWGEMMWHDELTDFDMVDLAMFGQEHRVVAVDDAVMALYHRELDKGLYALTGTRIRVSERVMDEAWTLAMMKRSRNPFREWMESHEWDGVPRLRTWFIDYLGAGAFPLKGAEEREYIESVTQAWFMGAVARQYGEAKHEVVPVFLGDQGIGKGSVLRFTAGADHWYKDTSSNVADPRRFLEGVVGAVVVELSEASQIRSKTSEELKAFISQTSDLYRDPYGRRSRSHPRRFVLAASTNLRTVFTDVTGNRRFYPMECHGEKAVKTHSMTRQPGFQQEVEQLWAEALVLYRRGCPLNLPPEMDRLAMTVQTGASVENPAIDDINDLLDDPSNGYADVGDVVSRTDITDLLQSRRGYQLRDAQSAYQVWTQARKEWSKLEKPKRVGERVKRGWVRIARAGELPDPVRAPSAETGNDLVARFKTWRERPDVIPLVPRPNDGTEFTADEVRRLEEDGYVLVSEDRKRWFVAGELDDAQRKYDAWKATEAGA